MGTKIRQFGMQWVIAAVGALIAVTAISSAAAVVSVAERPPVIAPAPGAQSRTAAAEDRISDRQQLKRTMLGESLRLTAR